MAVAFGSATSVAEATAANATYTAPSGITDGDLLLIWHFEFNASGNPPDPTAPSGFALAPGTWPMSNGQAADVGRTWLWYKIASGESGNYTVTHTSTTRRGIMARVTGNDTAVPFLPDPTQNTATSQTTTFTGLTTTVANELILIFGADYNDFANNLTPPTGSTPTFTEQVDIGGEYLASGILASASATGNKTMTNNNAAGTEPFYAVMVAVQASVGLFGGDPWVGHIELGPGDYGPNPFIEDRVVPTVAAAQQFLQDLTATVTSTASIVKQVGKLLSATVTTTASIVRQIGKVLTATVTSTATLAAIKVILKALTATVTTTATITNQINKALTATATTTATVIKQVNKALTATATSTATMTAIKVILRTLTATVTSTATMTRRIGTTITATATATGSIIKRVGKTVIGAASSVASLIGQFFGPPTEDPYPDRLQYQERGSIRATDAQPPRYQEPKN